MNDRSHYARQARRSRRVAPTAARYVSVAVETAPESGCSSGARTVSPQCPPLRVKSCRRCNSKRAQRWRVGDHETLFAYCRPCWVEASHVPGARKRRRRKATGSYAWRQKS